MLMQTTPAIDNERWLPAVGFESRYEISDLGRVKSLRWDPPRILKPGLSSSGYLTVSLGGRSWCIHELVLLAFVGPRPPGEEALHGSPDRTDSRLSNLRWGTRSDNIRDAVAHGTWETENRTMGRRSPACLIKLEKARATQPIEARLAALARGRQTRWGNAQ